MSDGPKFTLNDWQDPEEKTPPQPEGVGIDFPEWTMSGVAGDFANLYSSYLEPPIYFFYMAFLACLGSVLSDRLTLASELQPQPRMYVIFLGESADDRKSTAIVKTVDFFKIAVSDFPVCWGVGSAEGLQKRLQKDSKLLLCFDEFKSFVGKCQAQGSVLLPCVNTLFELNHYENHTKNSEVIIDDAFLTILAASTAATYENTWTRQFSDIGFNNRVWLVPGTGEKKYSIPKEIPAKHKLAVIQKVGAVMGHVGGSLKLAITDDALRIFDDWYMNLKSSIHNKRLDTYALRLMALAAVNELKTEVDAEIVNKILALCDWQFSARLLHDPIDADNAVAIQEEKIRRVLTSKGTLRDWELRQYCNVKQKGLWSYQAAKKNLRFAGELQEKNKNLSLRSITS